MPGRTKFGIEDYFFQVARRRHAWFAGLMALTNTFGARACSLAAFFLYFLGALGQQLSMAWPAWPLRLAAFGCRLSYTHYWL